ncbi:MAG TPA: hypothetical protein VKA10_10870, partial [Prolixibacteraceae bacterium]|nr:hypothetical protein [Prolixibacteraceae bacterium]
PRRPERRALPGCATPRFILSAANLTFFAKTETNNNQNFDVTILIFLVYAAHFNIIDLLFFMF